MAATKPETGKSLAALTAAALCLPGISAQAAVVANDIFSNVSYGHYQESSNRMSVDIYHADALIPLTDRLELSFSMDRDTYSGASPAYSLPATMANQPKMSLGQATLADIVSSASPVVSAAMLTTMGLNGFVAYQDAKNNLQAGVAAADIQLQAQNLTNYQGTIATILANLSAFNLSTVDPATNAATSITMNSLLANTTANVTPQNPVCSAQSQICSQAITDQTAINQYYMSQEAANNSSLAIDYNNYKSALSAQPTNMPLELISTTTDTSLTVTINFQNYTKSAYDGDANLDGCATTGAAGCYYEAGMEFGALSFDGTEHIHRGPGLVAGSHYSLTSLSDSDGVYIRAANGAAFSLQSMLLNNAFTDSNGSNPMYGANPTTDSSGVIHPQVGAVTAGPNEYWQILGFNTPVNSNLTSGDGTNYSNRVAYQTVANGFNGVVTLNSAFQNVSAVWIHYFGYPGIPSNQIQYQLDIGDIVVGNSSATNAWINANNNYQATLSSLASTFNTLLLSIQQDPAATGHNAIAQLIQDKNAAISTLQAQYNTALAQYGSASNTEAASLASAIQTVNALAEQAGVTAYQQVLDSAIPTGTPTVQHFMMMPLETRSQPQVNAKYYFDNTTLGISGGLSDEPDFLSNFGSVNLSHEFNDKLTTISGGYGISSNSVYRSTSMMSMAGMAGMNAPQFGPTQYPTLNASSVYNSFSTSLSQVLSKNTLFQSSINYTNQSGYLSNPYKDVYIRGVITPADYYAMALNNAATDWSAITNLEVVGIELFRENRPGNRNIWSFSNQLNHFIPELEGTVHFDYRFYIDDWGIDSHTFSLKWLQSLPGGFTVTPSVRYYSQSQADFFAPYFLAPRADGFYSSDYRLSAFGDLSGGIAISKIFAKGIKLDTSIEYVTHSGDLKLGGGGVGNYADFNYFIAHLNLNVNLSAKLFSGFNSTGDEHAMHHHHGAPLPAGVMFGHMMNQQDAMMVGYRFMYSGQSGDMLNGSRPVSDQTVVSKACANVVGGCLYMPASMNMNMHMLNIMHAPTDWLNLMVMPQLVSMDMTMSQSLTGFEDPVMPMSGMKMTSNNVGDTSITALVKVLNKEGHHVHAGLGISAPTGSIEQMNGSLNQSYGMQTGSGTWDFNPSMTYTGQANDWGWGAQLSGIKRLEKNKYGYALGDIFQATGWGSYQVVNWLSASVRGLYTVQGGIQGQTSLDHLTSSTVDYPSNYGGRFVDIGFGLNASFHQGQFTNHSLSLEWLQPVNTNFNGYQLDRNGTLSVSWNYSF